MKSTCAALVVVVLVVALTEAEREYPSARQPSVEESNYGIFRDMGPDDTVVNLPGGQYARDDYHLGKLIDRHTDKTGVNDLRRRRSAPQRKVPVDSDDQF